MGTNRATWNTDNPNSTVWVPAAALGGHLGSPTLGLYESRWWAWLLDGAGAHEGLTCPAVTPDWQTAHVDVYWTNAAGGSGNVRFTHVLDNATPGVTTNATGTSTNTVVAAPSQTLLAVTRILTNGAVSGRMWNLRMSRNSGDAADTLANDIAVFGLLLTRTA